MTQIRLSMSGKMKSGKDALAEIIKGYIEVRSSLPAHPVTIVHVAQSVYTVTEILIGYRLFGKKIIKKTAFERKALQLVGAWGRFFFGKDIWLRQAIKALKKIDGHVMVSGVRFPNEVTALKEAGFQSVYVECDEALRLSRGAKHTQDITETAFDCVNREKLFDYIVTNNNSYAHLREEAIRIIRSAYNHEVSKTASIGV